MIRHKLRGVFVANPHHLESELYYLIHKYEEINKSRPIMAVTSNDLTEIFKRILSAIKEDSNNENEDKTSRMP